ELLAEDAPLTRERDLQLGVRFVLDKGWHIYFVNPGDSGEPPRVAWTLPAEAGAGLSVGALRWPTPQRLTAGPLVNYGYEDEVMLLAPLHLGGDAAVGARSLQIAATVNWLLCQEECIPGRAQLTRTVAVGGVPGAVKPPAAADTPPPAELGRLFAAAERALPTPPPASWHLDGVLDASAFYLRIQLGEAEAGLRAQFVPLEPSQIEDAAAQQSSVTGSLLFLNLRRSEQLVKDISRLRGLLVLEAPGRSPRSFTVDIQLGAVKEGSPMLKEEALAAGPVAPAPVAPAPVVPAPVAPAPVAPLPLGTALLFALLGGMLLNLMPCVFPVLSIKALGIVEMSVIDRKKARGHALAYTAGILASFWALAGLLIALRYTGQQIGWGFHLQSPRFLIGLCALLFMLGLNLLGVFEIGIGLTQLGQVAVGRHGYSGAFATGVLATVVATPCAAPFMGTAVGFALSQPAVIALLVFSLLGIGLALPYVLLLWIPGLRRILPRPGAWMESFKEAMGFLLFATVLWLVWVLGGQTGVDGVVALLGGLLLVGVAGWMLHRWAERRWVTVAAVALMLAGAIVPGTQVVAVRSFASPAGAASGDGELAWEGFSPEKLAAYRRSGKAVFLDFTADWCVACKVNERVVLRSQAVQARLRELGVVTMKADWTSYDPLITQTLAEFGRHSIPFYVIYGRDPNIPPIPLSEVLSTGRVLGALEQIR
ncbi:MAG TPA: thioredoxin family protein, partial [Pseudomonadota bacterium]|nr:thioredoxin family protein [Pseudomonadota bacterium]